MEYTFYLQSKIQVQHWEKNFTFQYRKEKEKFVNSILENWKQFCIIYGEFYLQSITEKWKI